MTEPEIGRRCQSCGASVRERALFCLQCGKALKTTGEISKPAPDEDKSPPAVVTAPLNEAPKQQEQLEAERSSDQPDKKPKRRDPKLKDPKLKDPKLEDPKVEDTKLEDPKPAEPAAEDLVDRTQGTPDPTGRAKATPASSASAEARGKVQRATNIARHVGGDVVQRGQKLISSVGLDEAVYDPSVRFVLVAAVLFVLFLIIVLLNRFIV